MSLVFRSLLASLVMFTAAFEPATISAAESTTTTAVAASDGDGVVTIGWNGNEINIWPNGQISIFIIGQGNWTFYPDGTYIDNQGTIHIMTGELTLAYALGLIAHVVGVIIVP